MTGLEKILAQIAASSEHTCADIQNRTKAECDSIIAEAQGRAEVILKNGETAAKKKGDDVISRAKSASELETRSLLLKAKQKSLSSSLEKARRYLCELPDDRYFSLIYRMLAKYSEDKDGIIRMNSTDLARLPRDFESKLRESVRGSIELSDEAIDIDGGFVLIYGGIEVNCGFASVFASESERFSDEVSKILFA